MPALVDALLNYEAAPDSTNRHPDVIMLARNKAALLAYLIGQINYLQPTEPGNAKLGETWADTSPGELVEWPVKIKASNGFRALVAGESFLSIEINRIAGLITALSQQVGDAVTEEAFNSLVTTVAGKLDDGDQAADSILFAGKTLAQVIADARAGYAPLANPALTGTPTAPTAAPGTNTTQISTTAFVKAAIDAAIAALVDSSPGALDTLNELAAALGDDENFATTVMNALALKANSADLADVATSGDAADLTGEAPPERITGLPARLADVEGRVFGIINPKGFGAKGDGRIVLTGAITAGQDVVTVTGGNFNALNAGNVIRIDGAGPGGATFVSTIVSVGGDETVTLADEASTTVTGARILYGTDDHGPLQEKLETRGYSITPPGVYVLTEQLIFGDGSVLNGPAMMNKRRLGFRYDNKSVAVMAAAWTPGAHGCVLRVSDTEYGVEGSGITGDTTLDLVAFDLNRIHVDGGGCAAHPLYVYRAGNTATFDGVTAEGGTAANMLFLGCYELDCGNLGAYEGHNLGVQIGGDPFGWGSVEAMSFAMRARIHAVNNGRKVSFVADSATDNQGAGVVCNGLGRGSLLSVTSEGNAGRAGIFSSADVNGGDGGPLILELDYLEANGAGPLIRYSPRDKGILVRPGFIHPGNGSTLLPQHIKISATDNSDVLSPDNGPADPQDWLVIEGARGDNAGTGFQIQSNTSKYRVRDIPRAVTFSNRWPSAEPGQGGGPDLLVNGGLEVWQRGAGPFTTSGYCADGWWLDLSGATASVTREAIAPGSLPADLPYKIRLAQSAADPGCGFALPFDIAAYAGRRVILSFWADIPAGSAQNVRCVWSQRFGSGGSTQVDVIKDVFVYTTGMARYMVALDIPSIAGKTLGTGPMAWLRLYSNTSDAITLDLAGVQIDADVLTASPFRKQPFDDVLSRCQRTFARIADGAEDGTGDRVGSGQCISGTQALIDLFYPRPMRAVPSLIVSDPAHFACAESNASDEPCTALTMDQGSKRSARLRPVVASGLVAGNATALRATSASATLDLSAEVAFA